MSGIAHGCLADVLKDMENGTYDFTENGKCCQCGACCSDLLPMTDKEIKTIKEYIAKHNIKECRHLSVLAEPTFDLTCPFLNTDKDKEKCMIYPVRPKICSSFTCCPSKRSKQSKAYVDRCKLVSVRETFYG